MENTNSKEQQGIENLLKPRYKVIADWLKNYYYIVGSVINLEFKHGDWRYEYTVRDGIDYDYESTFQKYPHLFRKLQWDEERTVEEMPAYLKIRDKVYAIEYWEKYLGLLPHELNPKKDSDFRVVHHFDKGIPASHEEYTTYITKQ